MTGDGAGDWGAPPSIAPKRRNAVIRLYDGPVYRDWAFWSTAGWLLFIGLIIGFAPPTNGMPKWLDGLLAGVFFAVCLGVIPAFVRLQYRRWRWRRRMRDGINQSVMPAVTRPVAQRATSVPQDSEAASSSRGSMAPSRQQPVRIPQLQRPITHLSTGALAASEVLLAARQTLQYPIARSVRTLQLTSDPSEQYEGILDASEAITLTLGATGAAWLRREQLGNEALKELESHYENGVSQGTWHSVIRAWERYSVRHPEALPGTVNALSLERGGGGLLADLRTLLEERNRWAHGARPHGKAETAARVAEFFTPLERALQRCQFLSEVPWILTRDSSFRRRYGDFEISAQRAMGDHPEFDHNNFISAQPLADDTFYALATKTAIDLTPFIVMRYCPTCRQREVCYADRVDQKNGVSLKSFISGHVIYDETLRDEMTFTPPI